LNTHAHPLRVLYVEDAFDQALVVKAFFAEGGEYQVTHSQDGDQAVQLLGSQGWDLVVTDLNLPGTDGFEVIRAAKALDQPPPVLATTGYTGAEYHDEALRAGADDLLIKPLQKDEFLQHVRALVSGSEDAAAPAGTILAVGGLLGDVEMGCGGTLMRAARSGQTVVVVPLCGDESDSDGALLEAAKQAAGILDVRLVVDPAAFSDTSRRIALLEKAVRELRPTIAYIPAMDENHPSRIETFRIAKAATDDVPTVLGYQTATTGVDFKPTRFEDIAGEMVLKLEALRAYQTAGAGRLDLSPRMAEAYARYWGRFDRFGEVEAFEVIRGGP
jgi:two-component system, NtrC family, response regulator HydG